MTDRLGKLFTGKIIFANPRSDHREIGDHLHAVQRIFFHRKKLDGAPAFLQCICFPAESGINQAEPAQRRTVVCFGLEDFLLLGARRSESELRFFIVLGQTSDDAFDKSAIKLDTTIP